MSKKIKQVRGPVLVDQKEGHEIDFRVPGLSRAVVQEAEHLRVQEIVKKIENNPREAFLADVQQKNVYNTFSNKEIIRELGDCGVVQIERNHTEKCNVLTVFFIQVWEIYIALADTACFDSESRRKFNKVRLWMYSLSRTAWSRKDLIMVFDMAKPKNHMSWNAWTRCCKKVG